MNDNDASGTSCDSKIAPPCNNTSGGNHVSMAQFVELQQQLKNNENTHLLAISDLRKSISDNEARHDAEIKDLAKKYGEESQKSLGLAEAVRKLENQASSLGTTAAWGQRAFKDLTKKVDHATAAQASNNTSSSSRLDRLEQQRTRAQATSQLSAPTNRRAFAQTRGPKVYSSFFTDPEAWRSDIEDQLNAFQNSAAGRRVSFGIPSTSDMRSGRSGQSGRAPYNPTTFMPESVQSLF